MQIAGEQVVGELRNALQADAVENRVDAEARALDHFAALVLERTN